MQSQYRPISSRFAINEDCLLGKGSTGNVYLGHYMHKPSHQVAIKAIDLKNIDNEVTKYLLACQITSLNTLSKIQLPGYDNIVKLYEVVPQGQYIYLVMELLQGGTLTEYLKSYPNGLTEQDALILLKQLLQGYLLISGNNIVHRDLKPDNILFRIYPDRSRKVVIIDFGYCQKDDVANRPRMFYNVGSPKYMAPQAYQHNQYSEKSDIWALGIVFFQMLTGKTCDQGLTMDLYIDMLKTRGIPLPQNTTPFTKKLLVRLLCYSSTNRITCLQALKTLKDYQKTKNMPIQHKNEEMKVDISSPTKNKLYSTVRMVASHAQKPIENVRQSYLPTTQNISHLQVNEQQHKMQRILVKSKSSNIRHPLVTFNKGQNKQINEVILEQVQSIIQPKNTTPVMQEYKPSNVKSPQKTKIREMSPHRKININFVNQTSPQRQLHHEVEKKKNVRQLTQPDQNSIRIHIHRQNPSKTIQKVDINPYVRQNIHLQKERKLVGGFTVHGQLPKNIFNPQKLPITHQFVCRQHETNNLRQLSLPKTIYH